MSKNMRDMPFQTFVKLLGKLGYHEVDPELGVFFYVVTDNVERLKEILEGEKWREGNFNINITDREILRRYGNLLDVPWVQKKYEEMLRTSD